jgi:hypothetical protein
MGLLLRNHLYKVFLLDNLHKGGSNRWHRSRGCSSVSSVIIIVLIFIRSFYSHAVKTNLLGNLCDELIARLDHSFQGGPLFLQLLSIGLPAL